MSWEQLLDIGREAAELAATDRATPRPDCPRDGMPLAQNSAGIVACTFCSWRSDTSLEERCP